MALLAALKRHPHVLGMVLEREKQIAAGHTGAADQEHVLGELCDAAGAHAMMASGRWGDRDHRALTIWPWGSTLPKRIPRSPHDHYCAGAFMLADLERLDTKAEGAEAPCSDTV